MPFITGAPVVGAGPTPGVGVIRGPFPFAFDTPGISGLPFAITAVDLLGQTFTIAGNHVALFPTAPSSSILTVTGSTGNDGNYTVVDAVLSGGDTVITVAELILDATADGTITSPVLGIPFYTPTVGDILLDAWIEVDTPWDGTNPRADIGTGVAPGNALFNWGFGPVDVANADAPSAGGGVLGNTGGPSAAGGGANEGIRNAPARFSDANPLYVWVSAGGGREGPPLLDATQGAAALYIVTSTPVAP